MSMQLLYWIWLSSIKGVGPVIAKELLKKFKEPEIIYNSKEIDLLKIKGIGKCTVKAIIEGKNLTKAQEILDKCIKLNIKIITYNDQLYPSQVKRYEKSPIILYYKGNLQFNTMGIAIVGSRRCSEYGKRVAKETSEILAKNNIAVISGMAKGIDSYAHTGCINAGGYTIAVLGCGVDICYPKEHINLMDKIIETGAVVSEYPPGTMPNPKFFPRRNAIISAFSKKILVVEATEKSGAIITANYGFSMKKEVLAVPNTIYASESKGCNKLIDDGAKIYINPNQLLIADMPLDVPQNSHKEQNKFSQFTQLEQKIINIIKEKSRTTDEISLITNIENDAITDILFSLELNGAIELTAGIWCHALGA